MRSGFGRFSSGAVIGAVICSGIMLARAQLLGESPSSGIPYQGFLEQNGVGINGAVDVQFEVLDAASSVAWTELHSNVTVNAGAFAVTLGDTSDASLRALHAAVQAGAASLRVSVGPVGGSLVALGGTQRLASVGYAHRAAPGQAFVVDSRVGIGTVTPATALDVVGAGTFTGSLGLGTNAPKTKLDIRGTAGVDGIRFPDGSLQTSAVSGGGVYDCWGCASSPAGTQELYRGYIFGAYYAHTTKTAICMDDPIDATGISEGPSGAWGYYLVYETGSYSPFNAPPENNPIRCTVYWNSAPEFTRWGKATCPNGWSLQRAGYMVSGHTAHGSAANYLCVDQAGGGGVDTSKSVTAPPYSLYSVSFNLQSETLGADATKVLPCAVCARAPTVLP